MEHGFLANLQDGSPLQDFIIEVRGYANELTIEVKPENIYAVLKMLKEKYAFNYLVDITATDLYTDEKRFEIAYNIASIGAESMKGLRMRVSCRVEEDEPEVESVVPLWASADWYERECFDMLGVTFRNHPDLRRIYMPEDFQYFPLRKEFPLLGIPGSIEMPERSEREY